MNAHNMGIHVSMCTERLRKVTEWQGDTDLSNTSEFRCIWWNCLLSVSWKSFFERGRSHSNAQTSGVQNQIKSNETVPLNYSPWRYKIIIISTPKYNTKPRLRVPTSFKKNKKKKILRKEKNEKRATLSINSYKILFAVCLEKSNLPTSYTRLLWTCYKICEGESESCSRRRGIKSVWGGRRRCRTHLGEYMTNFVMTAQVMWNVRGPRRARTHGPQVHVAPKGGKKKQKKKAWLIINLQLQRRGYHRVGQMFGEAIKRLKNCSKTSDATSTMICARKDDSISLQMPLE